MPEFEFLTTLLPDAVAAAAVITVTILFLRHLREASKDSKEILGAQSKAFADALDKVQAASERGLSVLFTRIEALEHEQMRTNETLARMESANDAHFREGFKEGGRRHE